MLVEDNPADARLVREALAEHQAFSFQVAHSCGSSRRSASWSATPPMSRCSTTSCRTSTAWTV